ncbi:hypothetical protein SERLADRAFT_443209 [Serpula lacrymans var. lacrymans S7.9]|nr:uncharacterized protein SERLADRAFT_443209 [Serpula lacrymans var. lacrymans S7.9]EGO19166.1 hypothetical protein SERLADRAFT_443209 [Serpula lacrymans var. lacrymans S7.9]
MEEPSDQAPSPSTLALSQTRGYQQEMLDASLKGNIIIAQDTGSGKTRIAILRMKIEAECEPNKVSWFLAPTVALCQQQADVIKLDLPVSVGMISGACEPIQWKESALWRGVLQRHRILVTTPQVLLDALRHGYINLGRDIGLLIFDEAHHATDNHPYNCIMKEFYFKLPVRQSDLDDAISRGVQRKFRNERPMVLGLTASPIFGGDPQHAFRVLESNLDGIIRSPQQNRQELAKFVHRPIFRHVLYNAPASDIQFMSCNLMGLNQVISGMNIEEDPYISSLREQLAKSAPGPERIRIDQKLSKTLQSKSSYTHKGLRDLATTAQDICYDVGPWAADWYIAKVIEKALDNETPFDNIISVWQDKEKRYLLDHLRQVVVMPTSYDAEDVTADASEKVKVLVQSLLDEKAWAESHNEPYSGIVFVTRRDVVLALTEVLAHHPETSQRFRVGCLLGSSDSAYRRSFLDITRTLLKQSQANTLLDFRSGDINLIIATAVAEEGLDIQACGNVIRWDAPNNMASWAQSRGRARRERSSFVLMFQAGSDDKQQVMKWEQLEKQMMDLYSNDQRDTGNTHDENDESTLDDHGDLEFQVESTGALLSLQSAVSHLNHFCSILPNSYRVSHLPIYDIDPPDMPEGWHSFEHKSNVPPYPGPFGCTVTLPRLLPSELRVFSVKREYPSKQSAIQHVAFNAYLALYNAKLLNDNLLPLTSVIEENLEEEVKALLRDVEKRSGTATVRGQLDPWIPTKINNKWWSTELVVDGLPSLRMLTLVKPTISAEQEMPTLYHPLRGEMKVRLRHLGIANLSPGDLQSAQCYTRRIFWGLSAARMTWDKLDFAYNFQCMHDENGSKWAERRTWLEKRHDKSSGDSVDFTMAHAVPFGEAFSFPNDITWVRDSGDFSARIYRFLSWKHDPLSPEEEEFLRLKYARFTDVQITLPVIVAEPLPRRANFLLTRGLSSSAPAEKTVLLLPRYTRVVLLSPAETEYAQILPSIIRHLSVMTTVISLRDTLFTGTPLSKIPLPLLTTALTAPVSQGLINYERLETLGDGVLKFIVSIHLMAAFPHWHEGYLTRRKDHGVSNAQLAKNAVLKKLYRWIIRDRFTPRKWTPRYCTPPQNEDQIKEEVEVEGSDSRKSRAVIEELSTKMLADVVESLIGAAYEHGGFDLGIECAKFFGLGLEWWGLAKCVETALSVVETTDDFPAQVTDVELMLGYNFTRKLLLIEALTHASHQFDTRTVSYERMEFLGDSILDMIITDYLYHVPGKGYSPGHMHMRKSSVVNTHFLAFICLRNSLKVDTSMPGPNHEGRITLNTQSQEIYLWQCLLHSSHTILEDQKTTFSRYNKVKAQIEDALQNDSIFPWAALTKLQAPKFFSDMIESLIGAAYLDSGGNINVVREILRKLGILPTLERIVRDDVDVLHPVSRVSLWTQREYKTIEYIFNEEGGGVTCSILIDGKEAVRAHNERRGHAGQEEAKYEAAEKAIKFWHLHDEFKDY